MNAPNGLKIAIAALFRKVLDGGRPPNPAAVKNVVDAMRGAMLEHAELDPEVIETFNGVLKGLFVVGPQGVVLTGGESGAWHARCIAAVFLGLASEAVLFQDSNSAETRAWGWDSLNADAKGWCLKLLDCHLPPGTAPEVINLLGLAKDDVRVLLRLSERRGERMVDRSDVLLDLHE
jgi:hypothetical protein